MDDAPFEFKLPDAPDATIWRYMNFTNFVDMLEHRGLFFPRIDKFRDAWEGTWEKPSPFSGMNIRIPGTNVAISTDDFYQLERKLVVVSCWYVDRYESNTMWEQYGGESSAVAIKSTVSRLRLCLPLDRFNIGLVQYKQYDPALNASQASITAQQHLEALNAILLKYATTNVTDIRDLPFDEMEKDFESAYSVTLPRKISDEERLFGRAMQKRIEFKNENELRAVAWLPRLRTDVEWIALMDNKLVNPPAPGYWQKLSLSKLTESIYVGPGAGHFKELVEKVVKRYRLEIPVYFSTMDAKPQV